MRAIAAIIVVGVVALGANPAHAQSLPDEIAPFFAGEAAPAKAAPVVVTPSAPSSPPPAPVVKTAAPVGLPDEIASFFGTADNTAPQAASPPAPEPAAAPRQAPQAAGAPTPSRKKIKRMAETEARPLTDLPPEIAGEMGDRDTSMETQSDPLSVADRPESDPKPAPPPRAETLDTEPRPRITQALSVAAEAVHPLQDPLGVASETSDVRRELQTQWSANAPCQQMPPPGTLTMAQVIRRSLCHNPETQQTWANVLTQAAVRGGAFAPYLPTVSGQVEYGRSNFKPDGGSSDGTTTRTSDLSASYLLFDFGGRAADAESARQGLISSNFTHNAAVQDLFFRTLQAYYQMFSSEASLAAAKEAEEASAASYDAAKTRYEVGSAPLVDKLQAEAALSDRRLKREQAENLRNVARGQLANLMGVAPNTPFQLTEADFVDVPALLELNVADLLARASQERPEIKASRARVESARADLDSARSQGLPTVSLNGTVGDSDVRSGTGLDSRSSQVGLVLRVPLFGGFSDTYRIRAAESTLASAQAEKFRTENDIALDAWRSYQNYETANQGIRTAETLIRSSREAEALALGRYKAGAGSLIDLLNAQAQLADARQQYVSARFNWLITRADLVRAIGDYRFLESASSSNSSSAMAALPR